MKKWILQYPRILYFMRITLLQSVLIFISITLGYANRSLGQDFLDKTLTLYVDNLEMKKALALIEEKSGVRFVYSPSNIGAERKVTIIAHNRKLSEILDHTLKPLNVSFRVIEGQIMLQRAVMPEPYRAGLPASLPVIRPEVYKRTITGRVTDDAGEPLIGVSIYEKGITGGSVSDANGRYSLAVEGEKSTLVFSYVGYITAEIEVGARSVIDVTLKTNEQLLSEVVVVGYGSMSKKNLTSAISTVRSEEFAERPIFNVAQAMQGNAAGVNVVQPSGKPGAVMEVRIRGANSINSGTNPLFVIDGIQTYDISGVNPDDIVDINILKDATSTAIYGVNGSAGVVIITTKRGKRETKGALNFNSYWGLSKAVKTIDVLNLAQYKELLADINPSYLNVVNSPKYAGIDTDWSEELLRTGLDQNYNLSYSKGFKKVNVLGSAGYQDIKGIITPSQFNRFSGRLNLDTDISRRVKANLSLNYINTYLGNTSDNLSSARGGVLLSMLTTPRMLPVYAEGLTQRDPTRDGEKDGQFAINPFQASWENPLAFASDQDDTWVNRIMGSVGLEVSLLKNLSWKPNFTYDRTVSTNDKFTDRYRTASGRSAASQGAPTGAGAPLTHPTPTTLSTKVSALRSDITRSNYNFENTLNYSLKKDNSDLGVLLGNSLQEFEYHRHGYAGNGFPVELRKFDYSLAETKAESVERSIIRYVSVFGRVNYTLNDKYTVSGVFRSSGASQLARNRKWGLSPGISAAWVVSEEDFLKNSPVINELKIRGGWGRTGNVSGIPPYSSYSISRPDRILPEPITYSINQFENADLTWETTDDANIAFDVSTLNRRLSLSVDFYTRKTKNLLLQMYFPFNATVPYLVNAGDLTNKGVEFTLNTFNVQKKNLSWNSSINLSFNKNRVDAIKYVSAFNLGFFERTTEYAARLTPGQPIGSFFGYKVDKVDPENGKLLFKDINNDGKVDAGDRTFIGNPHPKFTFGFSNNLTVKNFYANMLISGSVGNDILNATSLDLESMIDFRNQSTNVLRRWKKPGDITDVPRVNDLESVVVSDRFVEDGSYVRVKALTLGYNFKNLFGLSNVGLYVTGQNLLTFTKYSGFDPEVNAYSGSTNPTFGIDYGTYPQVRTFTLGLKAGLN